MIRIDVDTLLKKQGKTRYWLAQQCGVAQNNFAKICNNQTTSIKFSILESICIALNCTPNDIMTIDRFSHAKKVLIDTQKVPSENYLNNINYTNNQIYQTILTQPNQEPIRKTIKHTINTKDDTE